MMKTLFFALTLGLMSQAALSAELDPETTDFAWKNGPTRNARYSLSAPENVNKVHIFEAFSVTCGWCQRNASHVKAMAAEYAQDNRVQFIDLGLDSQERAYQNWIRTHQPPYPVVEDADQSVFHRLASENGIPQTFVVACDGSLIDSTVGYWVPEVKQILKDAIARAKEITCES